VLEIGAQRSTQNAAAMQKLAVMLRAEQFADERLALNYLILQRDSATDPYALVVMLLPPIVLLVTIISKVNTYAMFKIASFMARKFSTGHPTWELFNYKFVGRMNPRRFLWGIGTFGIFVLPAMIATVIGFLQLKGDVISKILFIIDLLSLISIVLIFLFYHSRRMRNSFSWDESF